MKKKFLSSLVFLMALNLPIKALWILIVDRGAYNQLGPELYGQYATLLSFSFLFQMLLDFGVSNFNNKSVSQKPNLIHKYYPSLLLVKGGLAVCYFLAVFVVAKLLGFQKEALELLTILAFNQFLNLYIYFNRSNLGALQLFRFDGIVSILDRAIACALVSIALFHWLDWPSLSVKSFIQMQTIGYSISAIVSTLMVWKYLKWQELEIDISKIKDIILKALPFSLLALIMMLYSRSDIVMINQIMGDKGDYEAGIYSGAYKLLDAGAMVCFLFSSLLFPIFSKMMAKKEDIKEILELTCKTLLIPVVTFSISASIFSIIIMNQMYKAAELQMYNTFEVLIYAFIALACQYIFGTLLTAAGKLKFINTVSLIGLGLNIILNLFLIPKWGAFGAAVTTVGTQFLVNGLQVYKSMKLFHLKVSIKSMLSFLLLLITTIGLSLLLKIWLQNQLLAFVCSFTGGLLTSFATGLLDLKSFTSLLALRNSR